MGILDSLLAGIAQATHEAAKGLDEAVERGGGLGPIGVVTKSLVGITENLSPNASEASTTGADHATASAGTSGFLAGITAAISGGKSAAAEPAAVTAPKLGRSAHHYNDVATTASAPAGPHDVTMNDVVLQNVGSAMRTNGIGVTA